MTRGPHSGRAKRGRDGPPPVDRQEAGVDRPEDRQGAESNRQDVEEERERPTPVRDVMADSDETHEAASDIPSRTFESDGDVWVVRVEGRTRSGYGPDTGAPLLHLRFYRGEDASEPERHLVLPGKSLDPLYDAELVTALQRARPWGPPPPFHQDSEEGGRKPRGR